MLRVRAFLITALLIVLLTANTVSTYANNYDFPCGGC